ncbi:M48 family metallopeptidase [Paraclostridium bifermentans]|uniref:M48 family metalloprotease n=1 Tax=Paraclostridium bifermentans TaxID=1490 RepID=A0AA44DKM6_PARBF|nr:MULTISPECIES: M48 family metallopeptidase [Paraclostridium]MBN8046708.1 M48 family metallopeptidase [Paraclostridium bifermentans]MBZ6004749.1 M48 family metallopeptidase [Paraclostridium bifermentans]MDU0295604.1 M48 family metallopeptidase [Paraclostridium sp. MRS3W1]NME09223.1 M48 family metalloprotease [Paraclostridium bifermentans]
MKSRKEIIFDTLFGFIFLTNLVSIVVLVFMVLNKNYESILPTIGNFGFLEFALIIITAVAWLIIDTSSSNLFDDEHEKFKKMTLLSKENLYNVRKKIGALCTYEKLYIVVTITSVISLIIGIMNFALKTDFMTGGFGLITLGLIGSVIIILKSLYIKLESPNEVTINREEYPQLFKVIDSAIEMTKAPKLDEICILDDENIGVICLLNGFGANGKNVLVIGIKALKVLSEEELKAVIIHELAHIYNDDTKVSSKISRRLTRWNEIVYRVDEGDNIIKMILLLPFAKFYIEKLERYLDAMSQTKELLADKEVSKYMSVEIYAKATMKLEIMEKFLANPYSKLEIRSSDEALKNYFTTLFEDFESELPNRKEQWMNQIKKRISSIYDTHPSFKERMEALGIEDFNYDINFNDQSDDYKKEIDTLIEIKNKQWYKYLSDQWEEITKEYKEQLEIIKNYKDTDDIEKIIEYGEALEDLGEYEKALDFYKDIASKDKECAIAMYKVGQIMLMNNDEEGIEFIEKSVELDGSFFISAMGIITEYFLDNGMKEKIDEMYEGAN